MSDTNGRDWEREVRDCEDAQSLYQVGLEAAAEIKRLRAPEYPGKGHPWGDFLHHRCRIIDWLYSGEGDPACRNRDDLIAVTLSMLPTQVMLIRTRDRSIPG